MQETRPLLLLKKYRSVLMSTIIIETISFAVSLTDSLVAGNRIGANALSAIGLFSPFFSVSAFLSSTINAGAMMLLSRNIGKFDKKRAAEHFSQGCITSILNGVLLTLAVAFIKPFFISGLSVTPEIKDQLEQYYNVIKYYFLFAAISCVLDNAVVTDGGEKLSAAANSIQVVGNVVLSFLLSKPFGIIGIAIATVGCKVAFVLLICLWFLNKKCTLKFVRHFSFNDLHALFGKGLVRSSTFAATALMIWLINRFILNHYSISAFQVWVIVQKVIGLAAVYEGFTLTLRPIIGALQEENNTKAMRIVTLRLIRDLVIIALLFTIMLFCFPVQVLNLFGIKETDVIIQGTAALRIISVSIVFEALVVMCFAYYFLIDKHLLTLISCLLKDLICPVGMVFLLANIKKDDPDMLWAGLSAANLLSLLITLTIVLIRYKRNRFPLLLPPEQDLRIRIYAFDLTTENILRMSETAGVLVSKEGFSKRIQNYVGMCIEDMLNLVIERNSDTKKKLLAECTIIMEDNGVRVIMRYDGIHFDITDEDMLQYSFTRFIVDRLLVLTADNAYITTTGYNRYELLFTDMKHI